MRYAFDYPTMRQWLEDAKGSDYVVCDTEYLYPGPKRVYMVGLYAPTAGTIQWEKGKGYVSPETLTSWYKEVIAEKPVVFQNYKADIPSMQHTFGVTYDDYKAGVEDTILIHHVLWSEMPHDLGFLEGLYSDHEKAKHLQGVDELRYNAFDCITTGRVYEKVREELRHDAGCEQVYREELLPLIPIVLRMEERGIPVDKEFVRLAFEDTTGRVHQAESLANSYAGWPINLDSSQQLASLLFGYEDVYKAAKKLGVNLRVAKTEKGALSIGSDVVSALQQAFVPVDQDRDLQDWEYIEERLNDGAHPLVEARAFHIAARQNRSSYLVPLLRDEEGSVLSDSARKGVAKDGIITGYNFCDRIHAEFSLHTQATGRWSTKNPLCLSSPDI